MIHKPEFVPPVVTDHFPAHIHMNLLPRAQGQGAGAQLLNHWLLHARARGVKRVHVGVNAGNGRALQFWQKNGFEPLSEKLILPPARSAWIGQAIS